MNPNPGSEKPGIRELWPLIVRMGALAEAILEKAARAVRERDAVLASEVRSDDLAIDKLEVDIDSAILRALGLHAPLAHDLRLVIAVKSMANDLERVGDLARNMASGALRLAERPESPFPPRLEPLQEAAQRLLRDALDAFQQLDAAAARRVIEADDAVDRQEDALVARLIQEIAQEPEFTAQAIDVILIAESLERVADHATNIAEDVILVAEARNVKHAEKLAAGAPPRQG